MRHPIHTLRRLLTPVQYLIAHLSVGLLISLLSLYAFGSIAEDLVEKESMQFDQALANTLHLAARPALTQLLLIVTMLGSQAIAVIGAVVAVFFILRRAWLNLLIWAVALGGGQILNLLLKTLFARPRPVFDVPLDVEWQFSFPSGHAMMSIITYGLLLYFILDTLKSRRWRIVIAVATVALLVVIGFTRLYLGVHYLTDVIGGFAAGWIWLMTCVWALRFAETRLGQRLNKQEPTAV